MNDSRFDSLCEFQHDFGDTVHAAQVVFPDKLVAPFVQIEADAKDVIAHRDDILQTLLRYGVERRTAVKLSHAAKKGRAKTALTPELTALLQEKGVPEWYVSSMKKIAYLFPRAHATENCIQALRLTWYQAHTIKHYFDVLDQFDGALV